jgi:hypothetical protein
MPEEANDVVLDVLSSDDDNPVSVEQETTTEDSSPEETKEPEQAVETEPEKASDDTEEEAEEEATEEVEESEAEPEEKPQAKNAAQNRIRSLANENRALRQQVEQLNAQAYKPATVEDLVNEGYSELEAKVEAQQQALEVERFNRQVTELNYTIESEAQQVLNDFPVFDPDSSEYNAEIAKKAEAAYRRVAGIQTDPKTNLLIGANVLPYDFYKDMYDFYQQGNVGGRLKGQKAATQMLSKTEAPSSSAPKAKKTDPLMDILKSDD